MPNAQRLGHLGNKACLMDSNLSEARKRLLCGNARDFRRSRIASDGRPDLGDAVSLLLDRSWLRLRR
jgi:hypothetical protein